MEKKLKIAGNVLSELSDKIPSPIIAINELIKNSYDAGATNVTITLDMQSQNLIIVDNGEGMDDSDIGVLLQVAKSEKKYGTKNYITNRYTQGSKGLGFLSVFKFGNIVTWTTVKDRQRRFTINFQDILKLDDVSDYMVSIEEISAESLETGTTIEISLRNDFNSNQLKDYFSIQMNRDKILNSFIDDNFTITLVLDGISYHTKKCLSLSAYYKKYQLFHVSFTSDSSEVLLTYKNHHKYGKSSICNKVYKYPSAIDKRYKLSIELMIFDFTGTKRKNDPDRLFIVRPNKITPLIYINKNLFNNYSLFDPDLLRYSQGSISLPQMIGYIEIISDDKDVQFNSDRTQFQDNELTDSIRRTLEEINKFIQKSGSDYKSIIKNANTEKDTSSSSVNNNESMKSHVDKNNKKKDDITHNDCLNSSLLLTPVLKLKNITLNTPTPKLKRSDYIVSAIDSLGDVIDYNSINVILDGTPVVDGIIESIDIPCVKTITCSYIDSKKGLIIEKCMLKITDSYLPLETQKSNQVLIPNRAKKGYLINYKENPITNLVPQLNELFSNTKFQYAEVIACSLRSLFELSIYELEISNKIKYSCTKPPSLDDKVKYLVGSINTNNKLLELLFEGLGKPSYKDFRNELSIIDFSNTIKKCHLGAHKSTSALTLTDLESVGKEVALFLVIVNELLNNSNIDSILGPTWEIEIK